MMIAGSGFISYSNEDVYTGAASGTIGWYDVRDAYREVFEKWAEEQSSMVEKEWKGLFNTSTIRKRNKTDSSLSKPVPPLTSKPPEPEINKHGRVKRKFDFDD